MQRRGYLLRNMTLKIGMPSLPQAWIMSQCVQQLLEFIARQPGTRYIHKLTITSLNFFKHWRVFALSKWNILLAVSNFLLSQRHLQYVDLSVCRVSADDGMRLLRALVVGPSRTTVRQLILADFFQTKYQATLGNRFSRLLTSSFTSLQHLAVDARHVDSSFLLALLTRSPSKESLRHLSLMFGASPPREVIAETTWDRVRQLSADLTVTFVFEEKVDFRMVRSILTPSVPLLNVVVFWPR
ncbi:F-box only protein 39-like [Elysia marginata]|uniref:F-box only protein 39-like n=1 Tax=Elysia marginata TaxID=1093978 RepID=A0AAV4EJ05_9GAST|nr:F-box only protein 39-like [Elysia marginata]